ncbi:MAG: rod-binding protein, partial [Propionivibrio sp.]
MKTENATYQPFVLDLKAAAELRLQMRQDAAGGAKQAARQFEGMLLQMMLKSMREATAQDGPLDSEQTRFFTSIMDQQLAQNLSGSGGLGFAPLIEQQLARNLPANAAGEPLAMLETLQQALLQQQVATSAAPFAAGGTGFDRFDDSLARLNGPAGIGALPASANARDFVDRIWPHAVAAAKTVGVPPQFVV